LCKQIFPDAPDTIPVIIHLVKRFSSSPENYTNVFSVKVVNDELLDQPVFLQQPALNDMGNLSIWFNRAFHQMSVYDTEQNQPFCQQLESNSISLNEIAHASDGIYKSTVEHFKKFQKDNESDRPIVESASQVQRYSMKWAGAFIPKELWSKHQKLHKDEKIILHAARKPKLKRRLVGTYSRDCIFFSNRFILIKMLANEYSYSALFISTLINSVPMNKYFKIRFPITDVDAYMLHQLPIRRISFTTPADRRAALVDEAKSLYSEYLGAPDSIDRLLDFVGLRLAAEPEESDVVHDLLAYLAERI